MPTATLPSPTPTHTPSPTPPPTPAPARALTSTEAPVRTGNTPTPTINEAVRSITRSVVHVVGDGGSSTGFIVDKKGYIITSGHINDRIFNVDVWLPEGRMVGGNARGFGRGTGLALVVLHKPETLDLHPIRIEPPVRSTGPGEGVIAVQLGMGDDSAAGTRVRVGHDISDLAGNEWFRLKAKPPMASIGGPVLSERFRQVIGVTVLEEIAGEVDTFVLKLESLERWIELLAPKPKADVTSGPAPTAVPRESAAISEGWTYITRDCREGWTNCESPLQDLGDMIRVTASRFAEDNDATGLLPHLEFLCRDDGSFLAKFFPGGLEFNENDSGIRVGVWIDGVQLDLVPVGGYQYPLSIAWMAGHRIARPFNEAELTGKLIEVGSLSYEGKAIGVFDPVGFRSNYWRLPCAR